MLLRSSLPVAFWWLAVECAAYLLNRLPTKTVLGYMSPNECVYGAAPDLKWIRIWGCKCYALKPKADWPKDFDEKAYTGFLVGYAQQNTGYLVFIPAGTLRVGLQPRHLLRSGCVSLREYHLRLT